MSNYKKIERIEKRKCEIWKKKMELRREIDRLNTEFEKCNFEKCNNELSEILSKLESYCK